MRATSTTALDSSALRDAIARTARRLRREARSDLTPTLAAALGTVDREGPVTPSRLAEIEHVRRPTATRIVNRLAARGLVVRTADPDDGRSLLVSLTADGRDEVRAIRARMDLVMAALLDGVTDEERRVLAEAVGILDRMLASGER